MPPSILVAKALVTIPSLLIIIVIARDGDLKVNVRGGRYWVSGKKEKYSGNHFQN